MSTGFLEVESKVQALFLNKMEKIDSFADLYDTYFDRVNRYLRYRVPSVWDADDLTASVFIKALENYHLFRGEAPVAVWLFRIAHNAFVDYVRRLNWSARADCRAMAGGEGGPLPEEELLRSEELDRLRRMLDMLAPEQRDVVALRYAGELRFGQIARVLNKTESAVRMIHHRALKALRAGMKDEG